MAPPRLKRRAGLAPATAALLAALVFAAFGAPATFPPAAEAQAPAGAGAELFVGTADGGTLTPIRRKRVYRLTLERPARHMTVFTDRPARQAATEPLRQFVRRWPRRGFAAVPPNAALVLDGAPADRDVFVVTLSNPRLLRSGAIRYDARLLKRRPTGGLAKLARRADRRPPKRFGRVSLFVDAGAVEAALTVQIAGQPPNSAVLLDFQNVLIDPYPESLQGTIPQLRAQQGVSLLLPENALVFSSAAAALTATFTIGVEFTSSDNSAVEGMAQIPAGTTVTVAAGGQAKAISNGTFSVPVG